MADDGLTTTGATPAPKGDEKPAAPAAPQTVTLPKAAEQALAQLPKLVQSLGSVEEAVAALQAQSATPPGKDPTPNEAEADRIVREFTENPDAVLRRYAAQGGEEGAQKILKGPAGEALTLLIRGSQESHVTASRASIDAQYGENFFSEQVEPLLRNTDGSGALDMLERLSPKSAGTRDSVEGAINGIMGRLFAEDSEGMRDRMNKAAKAREAQPPPTSMGPGWSPPSALSGDRIPAEITQQIERAQAAGLPIELADLQGPRINTLEAYRAAQAARKPAA